MLSQSTPTNLPMHIDIRKAIPREFERIHALFLEFATFQQTPDRVLITPEQMVADQAIFQCLVATVDDEIVGFATYFFAYYSWTGKAIYLDDLYVQRQHRGAGIGSMLFDQVMELGKQAHCYKMKWQVSKWNQAAQTFYQQRGAMIDDVEINCELKLGER